MRGKNPRPTVASFRFFGHLVWLYKALYLQGRGWPLTVGGSESRPTFSLSRGEVGRIRFRVFWVSDWSVLKRNWRKIVGRRSYGRRRKAGRKKKGEKREEKVKVWTMAGGGCSVSRSDCGLASENASRRGTTTTADQPPWRNIENREGRSFRFQVVSIFSAVGSGAAALFTRTVQSMRWSVADLTGSSAVGPLAFAVRHWSSISDDDVQGVVRRCFGRAGRVSGGGGRAAAAAAAAAAVSAGRVVDVGQRTRVGGRRVGAVGGSDRQLLPARGGRHAPLPGSAAAPAAAASATAAATCRRRSVPEPFPSEAASVSCDASSLSRWGSAVPLQQ